MPCVFCTLDASHIIAQNEAFVAIRDKFPVARGHSLVVSKRHVETYFELDHEEQTLLHQLAMQVKALLDEEYAPAGYNLAMNCGKAAGQSVMHFHMHIIPRFGKGKKGALRRSRESVF